MPFHTPFKFTQSLPLSFPINTIPFLLQSLTLQNTMAYSNGNANGNAAAATQSILDAQTHIWNQMYSFINSLCLKCAVQLNIPDVIHAHGAPMTLPQLAAALPINKSKSTGLFRVLRVLVHSKIFDKVQVGNEEEAYALTPASRLLLKDEPLTLAYLALTMLDPVMVDPFQHLGEWLQNDLPTPFFTRNGMTPWEYAGTDPKWNGLYNEGMANDARFVASVLVKECGSVFEGLRTMVDVGGGTGMVAKTIADAFPGLKCIVLDLPHVVDGLKDTENMSYVSGDMLQSIPQADAILLKWTLNLWTYEEGVKILKRCKEAIGRSKGGKVIIVEMVVGNHEEYNATSAQYFFDIVLMTRNRGAEKTEKEWAQQFTDAGFSSYKISPVIGMRSVIEVFP